MQATAAPFMGLRLFDLFKVCRTHIIDVESRTLTGISARLAAMAETASRFELAPGEPLSIRTSLRQDRALQSDFPDLPGSRYRPDLRLLFADHAGLHGLAFAFGRPLRVAEGIEGDLTVPGPYLALVECCRDAWGKLHAERGFAQAVQGGDCFMPVRSAFERETLEVLLHLQGRLDDQGLRCTISRALGAAQANTWLDVEVAGRMSSPARLRVACEQGALADAGHSDIPAFALDRSALYDGSFVSWLQRHLLHADEIHELPGKTCDEPPPCRRT